MVENRREENSDLVPVLGEGIRIPSPILQVPGCPDVSHLQKITLTKLRGKDKVMALKRVCDSSVMLWTN